MVAQPNFIGVEAAAGFAAENPLSFPEASGTDGKSTPGFISLWAAIWRQNQDADFSSTPADAGARIRQALRTGLLKLAGPDGEPSGAGEEPETESGLFPLVAVTTPAHPIEPFRRSEWVLTGGIGPVGLPVATASESANAGEPAFSGSAREPSPTGTDAFFGALPQLAAADRACQGFLDAPGAPPIPGQEAPPESSLLKADAGLSDNIRFPEPAPSRYLATELALHRKSVNGSLSESARVQPEQSLAPMDPSAGKAQIATSGAARPAPELLPRTAINEGAPRQPAGHVVLAPPNVFPLAATREPGEQQGPTNRRGNGEPPTGFEPSGSTSYSYRSEDIPGASADRFPDGGDSAGLSDGQPVRPESGGQAAPDTVGGLPGPVKGGAGSVRLPPPLTPGGEPDSVREAKLHSRMETPRTEPVRRQLHVAVEGPEGARVDLRLLHTPGALHIRLASSRESLAEALRAEQHQLAQVLQAAGWSATAERPDAAYGGDLHGHVQDGFRQLSGARLAETAATPTLEMFAGSHSLMHGGAGRGRQHSAPELRQEWLDLSALRRFAREGGQTSR